MSVQENILIRKKIMSDCLLGKMIFDKKINKWQKKIAKEIRNRIRIGTDFYSSVAN